MKIWPLLLGAGGTYLLYRFVSRHSYTVDIVPMVTKEKAAAMEPLTPLPAFGTTILNYNAQREKMFEEASAKYESMKATGVFPAVAEAQVKLAYPNWIPNWKELFT